MTPRRRMRILRCAQNDNPSNCHSERSEESAFASGEPPKKLDNFLKVNDNSLMNNDSQINNQHDEQQRRGTRRRAHTRTTLLKAARQVFAKRGYHDASIAEITELADVGVGTFYLHFRDKDEIFTTMLTDGMRALRDQVQIEVEQAAPERAL